MNFNWISPKLAVVDCELGKGQFVTQTDCRGFITGDDWKIPRLQQNYFGYWQPYIQDTILAQREPSSP